MKDELLNIFRAHISIWDERSWDNPVPIIKSEYHYLIEELQRLMCYREVRAYYSCFNNFCEEDEWADIEEDILGTLDVDYPESMIVEAIEKVKNEQK